MVDSDKLNIIHDLSNSSKGNGKELRHFSSISEIRRAGSRANCWTTSEQCYNTQRVQLQP